jgi:hypothetical protein
MIKSPENFIKERRERPRIYNLKLHENIVIKGAIEWIVTRVEGGWIYTYIKSDFNSMTSVFVPEPK